MIESTFVSFKYSSAPKLLFFNKPISIRTYTLSLHDALPICVNSSGRATLAIYDSADTVGHATVVTNGSVSTVAWPTVRSEEHTSELQSQSNIVCRLLLEKKNIFLRH